MKKFFLKFRYYLALLFIITTVSNIAVLPRQSTTQGVFATGNEYWSIETQ